MRITTKSKTSEQFICSTSILSGLQKDIGVYALASAVNNTAAAGAGAFSVEADIALPSHMNKSRIQAMKKSIQKAAKELPVQIIAIKGNISPAVKLPVVTLTAAGTADKPEDEVWAGKDIVLTKWIGLEGTLRIIKERETELASRFTPSFLKQIDSYGAQIFALREIEIAKALGVSVIRQVTEGGVMAALFNLSKELDKGLTADMKKISVRQETIEVCEYYRLNPYQLTSAGCMLMVACDGELLADTLRREGIMASVIGRLTDSNDKMMTNGEDVRYIDRPAPDELMKMYDDAGEGE